MSAGDVKEKYIPRLLTFYRDEVIPKMKDKFGYANTLAVPRLVKITVNMGIGEGASDAKLVDKASGELAQITGQKAKITRARKPISNFKLRKGVPIGCCVTMRRYRMYEFLDRFITVASPRIRDFRGVPTKSFDGRGNYTLGIREQIIFAEINYDKVERIQGMNVSVITTAATDEEARALLKLLGMPFREQ